MSILELTERRYLELEDRINREVEIPDEAYAVYMTVVKKEDYDPINGTLFPVCPEFTDGEIGGNGGGGMSRIVYFPGLCTKGRALKRRKIYMDITRMANAACLRYEKQHVAGVQ